MDVPCEGKPPNGTSCTASRSGGSGFHRGVASEFEEFMREPCGFAVNDRFLAPGIAAVAVPPLEPYFREAGSGTAVVCIHSSASTSGQWRPLMERLSDRFRVIAMDLYGSGKTPKWPHDRPMRLD